MGTLNVRQMLVEELAHVRGIPAPPVDAAYNEALRLKLSALCLSGGGIRSAAFCLGVLQALAKHGLLRRFDYLSTVSGGGFIGGWLQQLIREEDPALPAEAQQACGAEARVALAETVLASHEPPALDRLRDNTNYLTPRSGPASADTWAGIALYLRNLTLNWIVFAPVFLLAALAPIFHRTLIWWAGTSLARSEAWMAGFLLVTMLPLGIGIFLACRWLPSHRAAADRVGEANRRRYLKWVTVIVGMALAWALLMPITLHAVVTANGAGSARWPYYVLAPPVLYFATLALAYQAAAYRASGRDHARPLFRRNRAHWLEATLGSAATLALLLLVLVNAGPWLIEHNAVADMLTLLAPIVLLCVLLGQSTFYLGLRRDALYGMLDREWLARLNGLILGTGIGWTLFAASCLILSMVTLEGGESHPLRIGFAALSALASGFASSWLGKQVTSRVQSLANSMQERVSKLMQSVLPLVFVVALFALLAALLQIALGKLRAQFGTPQSGLPDFVPIVLQLVLGAILVGLIWRLGRIINVNRFSMHAVYRNRLIRAFLGTPRAQRQDDPFTGFDDQDDPRLKAFRTEGGGQLLFPVINMTLNISTGARGAWAERKGASFTATPLHCGSADLRPPAPDNVPTRPGAYVPTQDYAGKETEYDSKGATEGTHLGSMLTVSGAAASPNWGYHSAPQIAFLMTLFNVRLGAWYPNPAHATEAELRVAKPHNSLPALLNELLGRSTDQKQAVYLSDGGHFENLGVYEMLRRRCTRVLVIDAGLDADCRFFDLGMMIRKAEIDLPVRIDLATPQIAARTAIAGGKVKTVSGFAYGTIRYVDRSGTQIGTGEIIYIKPCLLPEAPASVLAYGADCAAFPHESTGDQWFSESQFESYRALGEYQGTRLTALLPQRTEGEPDGDPLQALFDAARTFFSPPAAIQRGT